MADGLFSQLLSRAMTPLVPQIEEGANKIADSIDTPHLDTSPTMARIKGFGAGATQGLGQVLGGFTSPVGIATTLMGLKPEASAAEAGLGWLGKGAAQAASSSASDVLNPATGRVMNQMYEEASPVFKNMQSAFGGDRSVGGLNKLGNNFPAQETLGEWNNQFTPRGLGEDLHNVGKKLVGGLPDPQMAAYWRLLEGR